MEKNGGTMIRDISIIVPVYNGGLTIGPCLESLTQQVLNDISIEIIIMDDCSTDQTEAVCRRYVETYPQIIRYYRLAKNSGVSVARNTGLDRCSGRFVAFVDCDDSVAPDYIMKLMEHMGDDIDLVCCGYSAVVDDRRHCQHFFEHSCVMRTDSEKEELFLRLLDDDYGQPKGQLRVTAIGVPWAKLFRTEIIKKNGLTYPVGLRRSEDNIFISYYAANCGGIQYIDEPLYFYHVEHSREVYNRFTPETYRAIQTERDQFFTRSGLPLSERIRAFRCAEKAVMLNAAIKYLILHEPRQNLLPCVKALSDTPEFNFSLKDVSLRLLSRKQRMYVYLYILYQMRLYRILCMIWKLFFALKGTKEAR